jgi:hypothetical protein
MSALYPIFEYRIVEILAGDVASYMPQRGIPANAGALVSRFIWRDAVPYPAPSYGLAARYLGSIQRFDQVSTEGRVVASPAQCHKSPTSAPIVSDTTQQLGSSPGPATPSTK